MRILTWMCRCHMGKRWIRIRITPIFGVSSNWATSYIYRKCCVHSHRALKPVSVSADMGTFTLQSGTPTGGGLNSPTPPTPPTPVFPPLRALSLQCQLLVGRVNTQRIEALAQQASGSNSLFNNRPILQSRNLMRRMLRSDCAILMLSEPSVRSLGKILLPFIQKPIELILAHEQRVLEKQRKAVFQFIFFVYVLSSPSG